MIVLQYWREIGFAVFCLAVVTQLFYYLVIFRRLAFYKPKPKQFSQQQPLSVVICARDEADNIVKNLPGVLLQKYPYTNEVILVNDNSVDDTKYLIEELQKTFKQLNPIQLKQEAMLIAGKKFPLSMGIKSAKYETLLLTDADCVPASENWMQLMQDGYYPGTDIVLGYGAYRKTGSLLNKIIRFETFHSALQYLSYALSGIPYMGVGRNLSYRKDLFLRNKGFSAINQIPGGDDDLFINQVATKTNTSIVIDPEAHTLSTAKESWGDWVKQKARHYTTAKYYKPRHKRLLFFYSASQSMTYIFLVIALFYNWWLALAIFAVRLIVQSIMYYKTMKKLNEADLFPFFILFELWMCLYYFIFFPSIFRKPKKTWN